MPTTEPLPRKPSSLFTLLLLPAAWLERTRGWRRLALLALYLLIVVVGAALISWTTQLRGLPDIGDPFDVAAFIEESHVSDEDNAFVLYRKARTLLKPWEWPTDEYPDGPPAGFGNNWRWADAEPPLRLWLEANAMALDVWKSGTERPQALLVPPNEVKYSFDIELVHTLIDFARLGVLQATRLEEAGDMDAAWPWYRAVLRSGRHAGEHGFIIQRMIGQTIQNTAINELPDWAEAPSTSTETIEQALEEIKALRNTIPRNSDALKVEYLAVLEALENPDPYLGANAWNDPNATEWYQQDFFAPNLIALIRRENERSRRVVRLYFSAWLAHADLPPDQRPPLQILESGGTYPPQTQGQPLSPEELDAWFQSTNLARSLLPAYQSMLSFMDRDRAQLDAILVHLADVLYQREHGKPPEQFEDLVGPYLDDLPPGYRALNPED